jgi:hypothetical protein
VGISDDWKWYDNGSRGYTIVRGSQVQKKKTKLRKKGSKGKLSVGKIGDVKEVMVTRQQKEG